MGVYIYNLRRDKAAEHAQPAQLAASGTTRAKCFKIAESLHRTRILQSVFEVFLA